METPLGTELVQPPQAASAAPALPALRPLSTGEVIDRALQLFRANFSRLFIVMLTFQAPIYVLAKVALLRTASFVRQTAKGAQASDLVQLAWLMLLIAAIGFVSLLLYQLSLAAITAGSARAYLGERIEAGLALREGFERAPQLVGTYLVLLAWCTLLLVLSTVPGVGAMALSFAVAAGPGRVALFVAGVVLALLLELVVLLYLLLRYAVVSEVVVIEKRSFIGSMRRSAALMAGRIGPSLIDNCKIRLSILYAVNFCISISVMAVTSLPTALLNSAYGVSPIDPERFDPSLVPLYLSVPVDVLGILTQAAVTPFGLLAVTVFYFDLRIRKEGFDLELLASRMGTGK
ncbi:MAG TPA: hypothetical protein VGK67_12240 [Myxococcales bacterium]